MINISGEFHKGIVIPILKEIFNDCRDFKVIDLGLDTIKVNCSSGLSNYCKNYKPDYAIRYLKSNWIVAFEVLDTQSDDKAMADIMKVIFCDDIKTAIFIVKDKKRKAEIEEIFKLIKFNLDKIIRDNLNRYGAKKITKEELKKRKIISVKTTCESFTKNEKYESINQKEFNDSKKIFKSNFYKIKNEIKRKIN